MTYENAIKEFTNEASRVKARWAATMAYEDAIKKLANEASSADELWIAAQQARRNAWAAPARGATEKELADSEVYEAAADAFRRAYYMRRTEEKVAERRAYDAVLDEMRAEATRDEMSRVRRELIDAGADDGMERYLTRIRSIRSLSAAIAREIAMTARTQVTNAEWRAARD